MAKGCNSVAPLRRKLLPLRSDLAPMCRLLASPRSVLVPVRSDLAVLRSSHGARAQIKCRQPINSYGAAAQVSAVLYVASQPRARRVVLAFIRCR